MALKENTLVSVNKTQAYCYSFKVPNSLQGRDHEVEFEDSEMADADYLEGGASCE